MIHCAVVAMLSWLSFSADSFESTASSVYAMSGGMRQKLENRNTQPKDEPDQTELVDGR
jgi:hypothetical protein